MPLLEIDLKDTSSIGQKYNYSRIIFYNGKMLETNEVTEFRRVVKSTVVQSYRGMQL